jgi:hypothetical protein
MSERPIIFSGEMVRAILEGRKTQTRRPIRDDWWRCLDPDDDADRCQALTMCPYGVPGDRLWVREKWGFSASVTTDGHDRWMRERETTYMVYAADDGACAARWRSSIHMPRWASRLTLEVTEVRIQRLQEISRTDVAAEGVAASCDHKECSCWLDNFRTPWDSINSKRTPWASNPWCWAISFRVQR